MKLHAMITTTALAMLLSVAPAWAQAAGAGSGAEKTATTAPAAAANSGQGNAASEAPETQPSQPGAHKMCGVERMGGGHRMNNTDSKMNGQMNAKMDGQRNGQMSGKMSGKMACCRRHQGDKMAAKCKGCCCRHKGAKMTPQKMSRHKCRCQRKQCPRQKMQSEKKS